MILTKYMTLMMKYKMIHLKKKVASGLIFSFKRKSKFTKLFLIAQNPITYINKCRWKNKCRNKLKSFKKKRKSKKIIDLFQILFYFY